MGTLYIITQDNRLYSQSSYSIICLPAEYVDDKEELMCLGQLRRMLKTRFAILSEKLLILIPQRKIKRGSALRTT